MVSTVYLLIILSTILHYYLNMNLAYLHVYYLIVLYPLHFQPIPKGSNKDLTNIKNYRGIALSSLISKFFDNCIISSNSYICVSDDLQFPYKKKTSTVQCVSIIKEVINYYVNQNSCVYMCMLDASKAFDRVNLLVLFNKLYAKGLSPSYLRFLMVLYKEQNMGVR